MADNFNMHLVGFEVLRSAVLGLKEEECTCKEDNLYEDDNEVCHSCYQINKWLGAVLEEEK